MKTVTIGYTNDNTGTEIIDPSLVIATECAQPTSRVLDGSSDHGYAQEWTERAILPDGRICYRVYLFDESDLVDDDGEFLEFEEYPWDDDHVARILLAD